jgi:hypothetical protein
MDDAVLIDISVAKGAYTRLSRYTGYTDRLVCYLRTLIGHDFTPCFCDCRISIDGMPYDLKMDREGN